MTTPFLEALEKKYPKATIHYLTYKHNGTIFDEDKKIDDVIVWHGGLVNYIKTLFFIQGMKYDLVINLFRAQHGAYLTLLSGAPYKLGFLYSLRLASNNLKLSKKKFPLTRDLRWSCSNIAQMLGFSVPRFDVLHIKLGKKEEQYANKLLKQKGIKKSDKIIGINCNATWLSKNWSNRKWIKLTQELLKKHKKAKLVFIGAPSDTKHVVNILSKVKDPRIINLTGKCDTLAELAALIGRFSFFITTDAGPMHIAFAQKIKSVALFAVTNPKLLISEKPWFKIISVHDKVPFYNRFNFNNPPICGSEYMDLIKVEDVLKRVVL